MKVRNSILIAAIISLLTSCSFDSFERSKDVPNGKWDKSAQIVFDVPVTDTISGYDISINVRNTNDYPYCNLYFFVNTIAPNLKMVKDTFQITLADEHGKWLGSGLGDLKSSSHLYKKNVRFPVSGTYRIELSQAMRENLLSGIRDVGIKVEKTK